MGKILEINSFTVCRNEVEKDLAEIVENDAKYQRDYDDASQGYGECHSIHQIAQPLLDKSKPKIIKNHENFEQRNDFEKYIIHYQVTGFLTYIAKTLKVNMRGISKKEVTLVFPNYNLGKLFKDEKTFKNVTELKRFTKDYHTPHKLDGATILNDKGTQIGEVESESRTYKTKPKTLPKKYQWLDELVVVSFGAYNPF